MKTTFDSTLKANLSLDSFNVVRQINHTDEFYFPNSEVPRVAAIEYLGKNAKLINIKENELANAHQMVSYYEPVKEGISYRLFEEKTFFDSTTFGFYQTYLNVPVWRTGLTVTIKNNPSRVIALTNNNQSGIKATLPSEEKIKLFKSQILQTQQRTDNSTKGIIAENLNDNQFLNDILGIKPTKKGKQDAADFDESKEQNAKLIRGRFYVYKYDASKRQAPQPDKKDRVNQEFDESVPTLPLPKVNESIKDGNFYLVVEVTFALGDLNWLMLVDVETSSVLYLEALFSGLNGLVFLKDPVSKTGNISNFADQPNSVLNSFRDTVSLLNLDAPVGSVQNLRGRFANVVEIESPTVPPPTNPSGTDFNYNVRTNDFAAVNAYFHTDRFFSLIENFGFNIPTYFNNTIFPISVDHRGLGSVKNAHCVGNGVNGIQHACFALADTTDTTNPIGMALDWKIVLHELGGHGILYDHVGSANFNFSHSAGDSVAMILNDPDNNPSADRFKLWSWIDIGTDERSDRYCNRNTATGWAWGGIKDTGDDFYQYRREQILSTTLFRIYRSIGGDSGDLNRRRFASEMMTYLILRTISTFTVATNPNNALLFCNAMMATDLLNWTARGIFGGAYNKVVRWSFEKQGLFQIAGFPTPVVSAGAPPTVDVYIEDGRHGEYDYQPVHWNCLSIWNRTIPDGVDMHHEPVLGQINYGYVKVKNRGTQIANGITVRGFHCKPSAGLIWPDDLVEMVYTGGAVGTINPNNTQEIIVGPFEWTPNVNAYGHDCMIMIASATNDPSNIDNFTVGEYIEEWRLVPNDNNVAQRNVTLLPAGSGIVGLTEGIHQKSFWVGNPSRKPAIMTLKIELPNILVSKKWSLSIQDLKENSFRLKSGEKRELFFDLKTGLDFTKAEIENSKEKEIVISVFADEALIGGMTYFLDANLDKPINSGKPTKDVENKCSEKARELLDCLNISKQEVKSVKVKKITLDIEMKNDDCSC